MANRRSRPPTPWREWFFSLLLGVGLALMCIGLLSRRPAPVYQTTSEQSRDRHSVGLEVHFGFQILLPEHKDG